MLQLGARGTLVTRNSLGSVDKGTVSNGDGATRAGLPTESLQLSQAYAKRAASLGNAVCMLERANAHLQAAEARTCGA